MMLIPMFHNVLRRSTIQSSMDTNFFVPLASVPPNFDVFAGGDSAETTHSRLPRYSNYQNFLKHGAQYYQHNPLFLHTNKATMASEAEAEKYRNNLEKHWGRTKRNFHHFPVVNSCFIRKKRYFFIF